MCSGEVLVQYPYNKETHGVNTLGQTSCRMRAELQTVLTAVKRTPAEQLPATARGA